MTHLGWDEPQVVSDLLPDDDDLIGDIDLAELAAIERELESRWGAS